MTSNNVANHYTALAHAYATTKASSQAHRQVSSIAPPTVFVSHHFAFCSIVKQGWSHHMPTRLIKKCQGPSWIIRPSQDWKTWEEYLESKPGKFTPDQIVTEITWNRMKIDRTVARNLKTFDWYFTSRLIAVIGQFEK